MKKEILPISAVQEKMGGLSSSQRLLLFVVTFLVLGAGYYFLKYKPQSDRIRSLKTAITQEENRLAELKNAAAQVAMLEKDLAQSQEEFVRLLTLLPDEKEIPGLLESVSQLGAQVGLENILFQPQPEEIHEFYAAIPVRLDLLGTYHELGIFFDKISKLNRVLKVDNLNMTRQKGTSLLQVSCNIITYRFQEQAIPKDASKGKK